MRRLVPLLVVLGVLLACTPATPAPRASAEPFVGTSVAGSARSSPTADAPGAAPGWLRGSDGRPVFLIGASYQGPAERAWRGDYWAWWSDDRFDRDLVAADFDRAAGAGMNALRIFAQRELLRDIREDVWWKLDAVVEQAQSRGLGLIVVFGDYDEPRVERVARTSASVAARYAGNPTIVGYELRNEPDFWVLQSARYPDKGRPPLQSSLLVQTYGERAARHYTDAFRQTDEGKKGPLAIPEWFTDEQTYYWHNNWLLSYALAQEATAWSAAHGRSDLEFYGSPEAARWGTFLRALDETYAAWLEPQIRLLREADPRTPISVGHHDALIAALPANRQLDVITWHQYPPAGLDGHQALARSLGALRSLYADTPVMLGEFGYRASDRDEQSAAVDEAAIWLRLYAEGYAGGLKWLLTDTRNGTDTMGAFRMDGSERPIVATSRTLAALARAPPGNGSSLTVHAGAAGMLCYTFQGAGAGLTGGPC